MFQTNKYFLGYFGYDYNEFDNIFRKLVAWNVET